MGSESVVPDGETGQQVKKKLPRESGELKALRDDDD